MKNNEKAKHIIEILRRYTSESVVKYISASADVARTETGHDLWEKEHKDEFSRNPYNVELERKQKDRAQKERSAREEILEYAINIFLDKIDTKPIA